MDLSQKILSDICVFNKYAKFIPELHRRETWEELVERNMVMHIRKYPDIKGEIKKVFKEFVFTKKVLPSMRSLQFGGTPIELSNSRIYNCSYLPVTHTDAFSETMHLLLSGCGVGFSVRKHHIEQLPIVSGPKSKSRRFLIGDSIEGWADAIKILVEAYFHNKSDPVFDYRDIRPKGARLVTSGGKAPGPAPLKICIEEIRSILSNAVGRKLTSLEAHDIQCHLADAVLSGGIRRAAMISLFSKDDMDMLSSKSGTWWELNPQRGRANNSVALERSTTTDEEFFDIWERIEESGAGEPGIFWTNDQETGTNPCCEISLSPFSFCNLTEINASDISTQEELNAAVKAAAFLGTLQAGYTDFHYLRPEWEETTKRDALIGVGMTGICSGKILPLDLKEAAAAVKAENARVAGLIGINPAARTTCIKPSGSTSVVLGCSSGIHAWHNDYYIRRMRVGKNEAMYAYMQKHIPDLVEDCYHKPHLEAVMSFPQKAPEGSILRTESFMDLLERVKRFNTEWVQGGHNSGDNFNNVSCTISLKPKEWGKCGRWMWKNRDFYTGISVMPYSDHTYVQTPFEDITKEKYEEMLKFLHEIDLKKIKEENDNTDGKSEIACGGGNCEINL